MENLMDKKMKHEMEIRAWLKRLIETYYGAERFR